MYIKRGAQHDTPHTAPSCPSPALTPCPLIKYTIVMLNTAGANTIGILSPFSMTTQRHLRRRPCPKKRPCAIERQSMKRKLIAAIAVIAAVFAVAAEDFPTYLKVRRDTVLVAVSEDAPADIVIPEGITEIEEKAFFNFKTLKSITIPTSVTRIGAEAFDGCTALESVTIPRSVPRIDFFPSDSLKEVNFSGTREEWTALGGKSIGKAVIRCIDGVVDKAAIPAYLKVQGSVITGYTAEVPENLQIPDGITEIRFSTLYNYNAFKDCNLITSVAIPGTVNSISEQAFYGCKYLETVTIAEGVASVGEYAFRDCTSLKTATVGAKKMNSDAFYGCTALETLTFLDGATEIGDKAFQGFAALTNVTVPGSVKAIGKETFKNCTALKTATVGTGKISGSAFSGCVSLEEVTLLDGVTEIGYDAFYKCASLSSIVIPEGVTEIGDEAFRYCTSLARVTLPSTVKRIGDYAFLNTSFKEVSYSGTIAQWKAISKGFSNFASNITVHCTDGDTLAW